MLPLVTLAQNCPAHKGKGFKQLSSNSLFSRGKPSRYVIPETLPRGRENLPQLEPFTIQATAVRERFRTVEWEITLGPGLVRRERDES